MKHICIVNDCNRQMYKTTFCNAHYIKNRRYGNPLAGSTHTLHGNSKKPEYKIWVCIKSRCFNVNNTRYKNYGGRGITMCKAWADSYEAFYKDMGAMPSPKHSIDRIDVNGNYEPLNCRWATQEEQSNNTTRSRYFTINGNTLNLTQWAKKYGLHLDTTRARIRLGWSIEEALNLIPRQKR